MIERFGINTPIAGEDKPSYQTLYFSYDLNKKTSSKIFGRTYWTAYAKIRTIL